MADSPQLVAAMRLLDAAKDAGFAFERIVPGEDGPLRGVRQTREFLDEVYVAGCEEPDSCTAIRRRRCSLIVPGGLPVVERVAGDALTVLHTVVTDWAGCRPADPGQLPVEHVSPGLLGSWRLAGSTSANMSGRQQPPTPSPFPSHSPPSASVRQLTRGRSGAGHERCRLDANGAPES